MILSEVCGEECVAANLGNLYWELPGYLERAEEGYRRSLEFDPGFEYAMLCLGRFLIWEDRGVEEGMTLIERYLESSPDDIQARVVQGRGYHQLGDYEKAVESLERAWEERTGYNHRHRVFLEEARNALAGQRAKQESSTSSDM
jgi:tetratricopeptide (TPR) repeat protein